MTTYFFDSSGIVKRYVNETGTPWVISVTDPATNNRIYVARITGVEVVSAIIRQERSGSISITDRDSAIDQFRHDFANQYRVIEISATLVDRAIILAETHALRGYDAVQLAAAIEINVRRLAYTMPGLTFVSADIALNEVATTEALLVDDPNTHS